MKRSILCIFFCFAIVPSLPAADPSESVPATPARITFGKLVQLILPNGKYRSDFHHDTLNKIKNHELTPDFAALVLPADDAPFELRRQYVMVMAELEPACRHLALIEQLASEHPADHDLSALRLVAVPSSRRASLIQAMARDPDNDLSALDQRLPPLLDADGMLDPTAYRTMLENWQMVVDIFTAIPTDLRSKKVLTRCDPIYLLFGVNAYCIGIPPFLSTPTPPTPAAELAALATLRNDTIRAVAMAMHAHPRTTSEAFAILHYGRDVFHLDDSALHQLALHSCQLILRDEDHACTEEQWSLGTFVNMRPNRFSETRLEFRYDLVGITPYGYLLEQALKTRRFHDPADFLQCFSAKNRKTLKAGLDFFAKPTASRARKILPKWVGEDEPIPAPELALPVAVAGLCGIDTAKGFSTLLAATETSDPDYRTYEQVELLALWANTCLEHRDIIRLTAIFRQSARRFPEPLPVPDSESPLLDGIGAMLYRIHPPQDDCALYRVMLAANQPVMAENKPLPHNIGLPESRADSARILLASQMFYPGPGMFVQGHIPFFSRSEDLGFLPFAVINYNPGEDISEEQESSYQGLGRELLITDGPERFWARITGAYLAKQDVSLVTDEITRELASIKTWPVREQHALARFLLTRWPDSGSGPLSPWFKQAGSSSPPNAH